MSATPILVAPSRWFHLAFSAGSTLELAINGESVATSASLTTFSDLYGDDARLYTQAIGPAYSERTFFNTTIRVGDLQVGGGPSPP